MRRERTDALLGVQPQTNLLKRLALRNRRRRRITRLGPPSWECNLPGPRIACSFCASNEASLELSFTGHQDHRYRTVPVIRCEFRRTMGHALEGGVDLLNRQHARHIVPAPRYFSLNRFAYQTSRPSQI
tara:strand:+ start:32 stop:418 length:387 start_codon:yes stop_codon:yes gene_type:complete